ncbi:DMT family transporter [Tranquillimonas alkanivorans]|uniref:Permease of the drug/metabolite transporter (DMT) superfamily n=1 Tax=Tranquillimonas alkanivorans TaxID=441119 RepID=A0A1I5NZS7_9RHOB|nr:DMT family transporter [Tranquillimonas alkanivorans]SFP27314.1 Permease of the drug/metabolite transporter (DMT) superfamily [Tranquillimonas alkanivorans]
MDNIRGIVLMVAAMAGFALEDMFIKRASGSLPTGQILVILGFGGTLVFGLMARRHGTRLVSRSAILPPVMLRHVGEVVGTLSFVTAISLVPLSLASAILQATPLAVTLGAALFLGEDVGWRRWSAIAVGLFGVLLILRPGFEGFRPASLFAVLAVVGLATRDLATRRVPAHVSTTQLSVYAFALMVPAGLILLAFSGGAALPETARWIDLGGALVVGVFGYYAITAAMRVGEVAAVTPFRYTRLLFALVIGTVVFGERPDTLTLVGAAIVIGSGLYTLFREARLGRARRRAVLTPSGPVN